ncbi:MAG: CvpA family protein [Acidobacteriota bacterium]|nr:CvpA family protein [Acidobacteriota bacterium]
MTWFDWLLVVVLLYSTLAAFLRGIILELFSLAGLLAAVLLASWNYDVVATLLARTLSGLSLAPGTWNGVAFLGIVIAVTVAVTLVARLLRRTAHTLGLGLVDRLLGACFGLLRGGLIGVVIFMMTAAFAPQWRVPADSRLAPYFLRGVHAVSFVVPQDLQRLLRNGIEEIKHKAPDWIKLPR